MEIWIFAGALLAFVLVVLLVIRWNSTRGTAKAIAAWFTLQLTIDKNMENLPSEYDYSGKKVSCKLTLLRRTPDGQIVLNMWLKPRYQKLVLRSLQEFPFLRILPRDAKNFELHIQPR